MFSPIVYTKTPENADENGDFRKWFQKWRRIVLKTLRFWCKQVKTETFENASVDENILLRFRQV